MPNYIDWHVPDKGDGAGGLLCSECPDPGRIGGWGASLRTDAGDNGVPLEATLGELGWDGGPRKCATDGWLGRGWDGFIGEGAEKHKCIAEQKGWLSVDNRKGAGSMLKSGISSLCAWERGQAAYSSRWHNSTKDLQIRQKRSVMCWDERQTYAAGYMAFFRHPDSYRS